MGITRVDYDKLVRKRRKGRPGGSCAGRGRLEQPQGAAAPPEAKDPIDFALPNLPGYIHIRSKGLHHFQGKVNDLSNQVASTHDTIKDLEDEILAGSTQGLGDHVEKAKAHLNALNYYHQREQNKIDLYRLDVGELRNIYQRAVTVRSNSGVAHPTDHPKNVAYDLTSKAGFIEALSEDYGYEPMHIIQAYHNHHRGAASSSLYSPFSP